jgi:hypothetical protein
MKRSSSASSSRPATFIGHPSAGGNPEGEAADRVVHHRRVAGRLDAGVEHLGRCHLDAGQRAPLERDQRLVLHLERWPPGGNTV